MKHISNIILQASIMVTLGLLLAILISSCDGSSGRRNNNSQHDYCATKPTYSYPLVQPYIPREITTTTPNRTFTPDDAYDEGYEAGRNDSRRGRSHGYSYDDSSSYSDYYEERYMEGYEEGYDDGYSSGYSGEGDDW